MLRRLILSAFAITVGTMTAGAADLPARGRIGAIFAEPSDVRIYADRPAEHPAPVVLYNLFPAAPWDRGGYNYGSPWSYYYTGPYYGGPYETNSLRLPYACGLFGYC